MSNTTGIEVYRGMNPDDLYEKYDEATTTFIFVPRSGQLYLASYPATHAEMLEDDKDLFDDVYADYAKEYLKGKSFSGFEAASNIFNSTRRSQLWSRDQAIRVGNADCGRIALDGMTPLISFWQNTTPERVPPILAALYRKKPAFKRFQDQTVLLLPPKYKPITVPEFLGQQPAPQRTIQLKPAEKKKEAAKQYDIGGSLYSLADLQALRASAHANAAVRPGLPPWQSVLCHPDLLKYPGLEKYRPNTCSPPPQGFRPTHPEMWRRAGRQAGMSPPPYDYGEALDFKSFFDLRDSLYLS